MKLKEKFEKSGLSCDDKARRRVNVSNKRANITAEQIERGVTIEELVNIGVPVYRYETQVTIHGNLPGIETKRVCGYKSLMVNGNGSLGVRYVAIDGEKKKLIKKACKVCGSPFTGSFNSKGFTLFTSSRDKQGILGAYQAFPRDLVYGSIYCGALMFGGYGLFIEVGSIDASNVDPLLKYLTGNGKAECMKAIESAERKAGIEAKKREAEYEKAVEERAKAREDLETRLMEALKDREPATAFKSGKYEIAIGFDESGSIKYKTIEFAKRGPVFCCRSSDKDKFAKYRGAYDKTLGKRAFALTVKGTESSKSSKASKPTCSASNDLLAELKSRVDWQEPEVYVTNKGKPKMRSVGIPKDTFWHLWKREKKALHAIGITIFAASAERTGAFKTVRGKTFEIKRKQWEVSCWKPSMLGFTEKEFSAENTPF